MSSTRKLPLLEEVSTNGNGSSYKWYSTGVGTLQVFGTWDGATVTIQGSIDGVNWANVTNGAFTEDTITTLEAGQIFIRAVVSGVGTSELSAYAVSELFGN